MNLNRISYLGYLLRSDGRIGIVMVRRVKSGHTFKQVSQKLLRTSYPNTRKGQADTMKHVGDVNAKYAAARIVAKLP